MSDLVAAAAAALGVPEALVRRSAAARATATGMTVDEVLAAWAGGGSIDAPSPAEPPSVGETPTEAEPTAVPEAAPPSVGETPTGPSATQGDNLVPMPGVTTRAPVPAQVSAAEAANLPEVVTVPTAGIRERTNFVFPRWLAAVMLIIPLFALFALGGAATGVCGEATELQTDVVSGQIVNCDGSEFTGSGIGGGSTDFIALGDRIFHGEGATCDGCHGVNGGGGVGPALTGVLTTFGSCADHMEWVRLGSQGFADAGRTTYGDTDKPVFGVGTMPSHASLSEEQLASVVSYERVRFGGGEPGAVLADCGLAPAEPGSEGGPGSPPADGSGEAPPPADGEPPTSTTVAG